MKSPQLPMFFSVIDIGAHNPIIFQLAPAKKHLKADLFEHHKIRHPTQIWVLYTHQSVGKVARRSRNTTSNVTAF